MIISASRRTDIPSFYSDWLINRFKEGFVCVKNPMNPKQISKIILSSDVVDGIVFWTKNPIPMLEKLKYFHDYMYYFQFTVNAYGNDIERNVPNKNSEIVPAFQYLSKKISKERVIWRYDPIMITEKYSVDYHIRYFEELAKRLSGYTEKCVISFIDFYRNTSSNLKPFIVKPLSNHDMMKIAGSISKIGEKYKIKIESCAEEIDLESVGIEHGSCIDQSLFERLLGCKLKAGIDKNQRLKCGCMESIDIGAYDTCKNGCRYCYANHSQKAMERNLTLYDPDSPLLCGCIQDDDVVKERETKSLKGKTF